MLGLRDLGLWNRFETFFGAYLDGSAPPSSSRVLSVWLGWAGIAGVNDTAGNICEICSRKEPR